MSANGPQERSEYQKHMFSGSDDDGQSKLLEILSDHRLQVLQDIDKDPTFAAEMAAEIATVAACEKRGIERCLDANVIEILARMIAMHPNVERVNRHAGKALSELLGNDPDADQAEEKRRHDHVCDLFVAANLPAALVSMIEDGSQEFGVSGSNFHAIMLLLGIFQSNAQNAQHCVIAGADEAVKKAQSCQYFFGDVAERLHAKCAAHPDAPKPSTPSGE